MRVMNFIYTYCTVVYSSIKYAFTSSMHTHTHTHTFVTTFDQCLIDVLLFGVFQDVEETQVDSVVSLFLDDVQQCLSGFDRTISQTLN